jgi:hypothetical protein
MAQVAVNLVPHEYLSLSKAKQNSFFSSGRRGLGDIRRSYVSTHGERSDDPSVTPARGRQGTSTVDKIRLSLQPARLEVPTERHGLERQHFMSSGRGGSGNIQPSTSDLEAHPLTASILSQHNAVQAQYEQRVRKIHTESNPVRSSGRGGSGNISDLRRSRSQGPSTAPKKRFFTTKGRERGTRRCDDVAQAHDNHRQDENTDRRASQATCSSGGSSALDARHSQDRRVSNPVPSNNSVTSVPLSSEDAITGKSGKRRSFMIRWSKLPSSTSSVALPGSPPSSPTAPAHPRSLHTGSPISSSRVYSSPSVVLEDQEYVSFLDL